MSKNKDKSALETAIKQGSTDGMSDKQIKGALDDAMGKLAKATNLANVSKEQVIETGTSLMHTGETMGSLCLGGMAEGYFGEQKLKLGGVDMRAPAGLAMQGYGLYQILRGKAGNGAHFLAIGNGVTGSWLSSVGVDAGKALAERRAAKGGAAPAGAAPAPGMHGNYGPTMAGSPMVYVPPVPETAGNFGYGAPGQFGYANAPFQGQGMAPGQFGYANAPFQGPAGMGPGHAPAGYLPAPAMMPAGHLGYQAPVTAGTPDMSGPVREIMATPETAGTHRGPQVMLTPEQRPQAPQTAGQGASEGQSEVGRMVPVRPLSRVPRARAPEEAAQE